VFALSTLFGLEGHLTVENRIVGFRLKRELGGEVGESAERVVAELATA
jgi:hypothetical protein